MAFNRFAAGKKVYAKGSYAPTRGTVDPKGYIQRELKRRAIKTAAQNTGRPIARPGLTGGGSGPRQIIKAKPIRTASGPRVPGSDKSPVVNRVEQRQKAQRLKTRKFLASHPQHWKNNPGGKKFVNSTRKNRRLISKGF